MPVFGILRNTKIISIVTVKIFFMVFITKKFDLVAQKLPTYVKCRPHEDIPDIKCQELETLKK